jgi:hypothetical protein
MTTSRSTLPLLVAALAALSACGHREHARVVETPPPSKERAIPEADPPMVPLAAEDPAVSPTTVAIPVTVPIDDRPENYWSVTSDTIANAGTAPAVDAGRPIATKKGAEPQVGWPTVDAGALVLPGAVHPGRVDDAGAAEGRELWLLALPVDFVAKSGFDKPLTRIDLSLELGANTRDWTILPLKDVGYDGLRHGPNPMPDGPFQYWLRSDQIIPALARDEGRRFGDWRLRHADRSAIPPSTMWYAVLATPRGAKHADATVRARLWFTRGNEATVTLPEQRIGIDFHR